MLTGRRAGSKFAEPWKADTGILVGSAHTISQKKNSNITIELLQHEFLDSFGSSHTSLHTLPPDALFYSSHALQGNKCSNSRVSEESKSTSEGEQH
jgi:hypothetical protein